jgi:Na+/H+-dicarboxylate symporter
LVPGSVGVRGVKALMENDIVSGIQFGFSMLTIALSIIVGLFVANMLFPLATKAAPKPASPDANNSTGDLGLSQGALDHIPQPHQLQRFAAK